MAVGSHTFHIILVCPCVRLSHVCALRTFSILSVKTLLSTILQAPLPLPVTSQTWSHGRSALSVGTCTHLGPLLTGQGTAVAWPSWGQVVFPGSPRAGT